MQLLVMVVMVMGLRGLEGCQVLLTVEYIFQDVTLKRNKDGETGAASQFLAEAVLRLQLALSRV